jgi:transposase
LIFVSLSSRIPIIAIQQNSRILDKGSIIKVGAIIMLSQEARELLIKTYETIHDATATAKIFGVSKSTVYARIRDYMARGTIELRTNLRGRKSRITSEDEDRIRELIEKNNDITIHEINETLNLGVCDEAVRKHVVKMGFRYKKKSLHATERERPRCGSKKK